MLYYFCPVDYEHFYPRSPCGERRPGQTAKADRKRFLSTLSLRRATRANSLTHTPPQISIHALLAESDLLRNEDCNCHSISIHALLAESDQLYINRAAKTVIFLSTLSLRRATAQVSPDTSSTQYFYPRSPCGERLGLDGRFKL